MYIPHKNAKQVKEFSDMKSWLFTLCSTLTFNYNIKMFLHLFPVHSGLHRSFWSQWGFPENFFIASINRHVLNSKKQKLCNILITLAYWWKALFKRLFFPYYQSTVLHIYYTSLLLSFLEIYLKFIEKKNWKYLTEKDNINSSKVLLFFKNNF